MTHIFAFLTKIFLNIKFSSLWFQNNNSKKYCLHTVQNNSNKDEFQKKSICQIFDLTGKKLLYVKEFYV